MAHLPQNSQILSFESFPLTTSLINRRRSDAIIYQSLSLKRKTRHLNQTRWWKASVVKKGFQLRCSLPSRPDVRSTETISKSSSSDDLANEFGWKVKRVAMSGNLTEEVDMAAEVQAEAFHVPMPIFNDFFLNFFQAEVSYAKLYNLRKSSADRYACLVAMHSTDHLSQSQPKKVIGVVDVTVLRDREVLQHLLGVEEYLYVSGVAVLINYRRQKVATVLLKACNALCIEWGFNYLALRAYEDDLGGRKLYTNVGYKVVSGDPLWMTSWIGRKRRVLMIKQCE